MQDGNDGHGGDDVGKVLKHFEELLDKKMSELSKGANARFDELETLIRSGFPYGDPIGHCNAHQTQIERAKTWKELGLEIAKKVASGTVWAAIIGIAFLVKHWWDGHFK
jgi:hypothetical protein